MQDQAEKERRRMWYTLTWDYCQVHKGAWTLHLWSSSICVASILYWMSADAVIPCQILSHEGGDKLSLD